MTTGERNPYEGGQGPIRIGKVRRAGFVEREFDTGRAWDGGPAQTGPGQTGTVRINYAVGPRNGPPLVLLPAQTGIWQSYQRVMPLAARVMFLSLSMFDPDFARAFVDGRMYTGLDHAEAFSRVRCPLLVLHADWFRDRS